jgi:hypothetical protein
MALSVTERGNPATGFCLDACSIAILRPDGEVVQIFVMLSIT